MARHFWFDGPFDASKRLLLRCGHGVGGGALLRLLVMRMLLRSLGGSVRASILGEQHSGAREEREAQSGGHDFFHFGEFSLGYCSINIHERPTAILAGRSEAVLKDTLKLV